MLLNVLPKHLAQSSVSFNELQMGQLCFDIPSRGDFPGDKMKQTYTYHICIDAHTYTIQIYTHTVTQLQTYHHTYIPHAHYTFHTHIHTTHTHIVWEVLLSYVLLLLINE